VLATAATVIASQAVITGAYSLIRQAVQLGLLPRFEVRYTSETHAGQIYLPRVNRMLLIGVMLLVLLFRTFERAGLRLWHRRLHHHGRRRHHGLRRDLEIVELARGHRSAGDFAVCRRRHDVLQRNLLKLLEGAWVPLLFGFTVAITIWTWRRGAAILTMKTRRIEVPLKI
jgi:KUP system potassium uptake protein